MIKLFYGQMTTSHLTIQPFKHLTTAAYGGGYFYIQRLRRL